MSEKKFVFGTKDQLLANFDVGPAGTDSVLLTQYGTNNRVYLKRGAYRRARSMPVLNPPNRQEYANAVKKDGTVDRATREKWTVHVTMIEKRSGDKLFVKESLAKVLQEFEG